MREGLMAKPAASSSFIGLLGFERASYQICLITYASQLVAQSGEAQRIDCSRISLQVISAAYHGFAGPDEFIRHRHALEPSFKGFFFTGNEARQKPELEILIASCKL